jgi:hypothetical protein
MGRVNGKTMFGRIDFRKFASAGTSVALLLLASACNPSEMVFGTKGTSAVPLVINDDAGPGIKPQSPPLSSADTPVSLVNFSTVLPTMSNLTTAAPSLNTRNLFTLNSTTFPLDGTASEVTPAMWMSLTVLAGNMCDDLYVKEAAMARERRIYYGDFLLGQTNNFQLVVAGTTQTVTDRLYDKLALGFWGRKPSSEEKADFAAALTQGQFPLAAMNGTDTRQALLVLCTGTLASARAMVR